MMPKMQASFSVWLMVGVSCLVVMSLCWAAEGQTVDPEAISALLRTLDAPEAEELPTVYQDSDGYIRFLGAPAQAYFTAPPSTAKSTRNAPLVAQSFLERHGSAFGLDDDEIELRVGKTPVKGQNVFVRLNQYYAGLPVFGAQAVVHVDPAMNIKTISANVMRSTNGFKNRAISLTPSLTAEQATERAIMENAAITKADPSVYVSKGAPQLIIFEPKVLDLPGEPSLAWQVQVSHSSSLVSGMFVVIDAHTGRLLVRYADHANARYREVYDANFNEDLLDAALVRKEGEPPTGIENIDTLYDYLGDCYDFYMREHGRDSFDNKGSRIRAFANYPFGFPQAAWSIDYNLMVLDESTLTDDIIAHEFSHGVTATDSDLIYFSYSGAIVEMFSDLGGEFVDLTNGRGNDAPEVRWLLGEDLRFRYRDTRGLEGVETDNEVEPPFPIVGFRSMKDPTIFGDPDRLSSPLLVDPYDLNNLGGIHSNSGIGNKLIYLLTDGDSFNGQRVEGMGISKVANLFYHARLMLSATSDYYDLYFALRAAAAMINFTAEERLNVVKGARAVEIEPPMWDSYSFLGLRDFRALPTHDTAGTPVIGLTWKNFNIAYEGWTGYNADISLYRSVVDFPTGALDGLLLPVSNTDLGYLDRDVRAGETYYYTLVAQIGSFSQTLYARAQAGEAGMPVYTEVFGEDLVGGNNPFDLSYKQITFRPVLPPPTRNDEPYLSSMLFSDYEVTTVKDIYQLPISRETDGGSFNLTYSDNGIIPLSLNQRSFPFFGKHYNFMYLSSNGYILFTGAEAYTDAGTEYWTSLDVPSLASHFAIPRISFFFTDLAPHISGQVWGKELDDRIVITLENVAVQPSPNSQMPDRVTVQLELFYSGHIRITYLNTSMPSGIVGLSDGRGVPLEPAALFADIREGYHFADLSKLSATPSRMSLNPIAPQLVEAGETIRFNATVELPPFMRCPALYYATWTGSGQVPFADNRDCTGSFYWQTVYEDTGSYTVRVFAELDGQRVFQDVLLVVGRVDDIKPTAINLTLSTNSDYEDPAISRPIPVGTPLIASFDYYHPYAEQTPLLYSQGKSLLYWFRNGQIIPAFTNQRVVPPNVTQVDDVWWFQVTPQTLMGIKGDPVTSPVVSVLGVPRVDEVSPTQGNVTGNEKVTIRGSRLSYPLSVKFGGVPGNSIEVINDNEINVLTPVHRAGTVTVSVETPGGIGRKIDAFTFKDVQPEEEEKTSRFLGCDGSGRKPSSVMIDLVPAAVLAVLLLVGRFAKRRPAK